MYRGKTILRRVLNDKWPSVDWLMSRLDWLIRLRVGFSSEGLQDSLPRYRGGDARGSSRRIIVTGAHYSNLPRSIYLSFTSREDVSCVTMSAARNPPACIIHSFILKLHEGHTPLLRARARKWKRILSLASATARQSRATWQTALFPPTNLPDVSRRSLPKSLAERERTRNLTRTAFAEDINHRNK